MSMYFLDRQHCSIQWVRRDENGSQPDRLPMLTILHRLSHHACASFDLHIQNDVLNLTQDSTFLIYLPNYLPTAVSMFRNTKITCMHVQINIFCNLKRFPGFFKASERRHCRFVKRCLYYHAHYYTKEVMFYISPIVYTPLRCLK